MAQLLYIVVEFRSVKGEILMLLPKCLGQTDRQTSKPDLFFITSSYESLKANQIPTTVSHIA